MKENQGSGFLEPSVGAYGPLGGDDTVNNNKKVFPFQICMLLVPSELRNRKKKLADYKESSIICHHKAPLFTPT